METLRRLPMLSLLAIAAVLESGIVSALAEASLDLDSELRACQAAGRTTLLDNDGPEAAEAKIEQAWASKKQVCYEAETAIGALEEKSRALEGAAAEMPHALLHPAEKADAILRAEVDPMKQEISGLNGIPNEVTEGNNVLLRASELRIGTSNGRIFALKKNWDALWLPEPGSPLDITIRASEDPDLPPEARDGYSAFLKGVPPYLIGNGPAPHKKLEFISGELGLTKQAFQLKVLAYTSADRLKFGDLLRKDLSPEVAESTAQVIADQLRAEESFRDVNWAHMALSSGACDLARTIVSEQINVVESAFAHTPSPVREALASVLQHRLDEKKRFLTQARCDRKKDGLALEGGLKRWQRTLPQLCASAGSSVARYVQELLTNISTYRETRGQISDPEQRADFEVLGEELWSRGHYLALQCRRAM